MGLSKKYVLRIGSNTYSGSNMIPTLLDILGSRYRTSVTTLNKWGRITREMNSLGGRQKRVFFLVENFRVDFPLHAKDIKLVEFKLRRGSKKRSFYKDLLAAVGRRPSSQYDTSH